MEYLDQAFTDVSKKPQGYYRLSDDLKQQIKNSYLTKLNNQRIRRTPPPELTSTTSSSAAVNL